MYPGPSSRPAICSECESSWWEIGLPRTAGNRRTTASIITSAERLARKRGSEAMGRCPTEADAVAAAEWLVDRLSRLAPSLQVESRIQAGGGQYLVVLTS